MSQETVIQSVEPNPSAYEYVGVFEPTESPVTSNVDGLDFSNVRIHVLKANIDELSTQYHAVFEHEPFLGKRFMSLLSESAPRQNESVYEVLADWDLPDRAAQQTTSQNYLDRLVSGHEQALGQHWSDFEGSRYLFMRALADGSDYFERNMFPKDSLMVKLFAPEEVQSQFDDERSRFDFQTGRRVYGADGLPNFVETVAGYLKEDELVSDRTTARIAQGKTRKIVAQLYDTHGKQYASRYFRGLTDEQKLLALENYSVHKFHPINEGSDEVMFAQRNSAVRAEDLVEAYSRRTPKQLPKTGQDVDVSSITTTDGKRTVVFVDTLREGVREISVQPVLSWQTKRDADGTDRELLVDKHDADEFIDPNRHVYESVIGGLLCVAYLSPEIRKNPNLWPNTMRFPGGNRQQGLGPAQVPVLALMRRNQLLTSELVDQIEEFAAL